MTGVCLASTGNDGRFIQRGTIRELAGPALCEEILRTGVDDILLTSGAPLRDAMIRFEKNVKPCCISVRAIVLVEERDGVFFAVKRD